jgi:FtsZ-binding cell division protein ZapB
MKSILAAIIVGIVLFGVSAGVSWFMIFKQLSPEAKEKSVHDPDDIAHMTFPQEIDDADKVKAMPVGPRPELPVTVEAVTELAQSIMEKERKLIESEDRLKKDEKRINLLFEDLRREREELYALNERIDAKITQARETVELLKVENQSLSEQTKALSSLEKKTGKTTDDVADQDIENRVKVVKNWFNNLEPETAADYLKEFANQGDIRFSAKLLESLDDRKIAKILSAFNDAPLVAQLIDSFSDKKSVNGNNNNSRLR